MGAKSSKPEHESSSAGETFYAPRSNGDAPIQFSEDLISHLSTNSLAIPSSSSPTLERQSTLDSHIQSRIAAELVSLRAEEANVRQQIETALEKENLDKERGGLEGQAGVTHSVSLMRDLAELEQKQERAKEESKKVKEAAPWAVVEQKKSALQECLLGNKTTPLNCQSKVVEFTQAVFLVEKATLHSI